MNREGASRIEEEQGTPDLAAYMNALEGCRLGGRLEDSHDQKPCGTSRKAVGFKLKHLPRSGVAHVGFCDSESKLGTLSAKMFLLMVTQIGACVAATLRSPSPHPTDRLRYSRSFTRTMVILLAFDERG